MFGSFGLPELLIILAIVVVLFGAGRIAGVGRALGQSVRGFREEVHTDGDDDEDAEEKKTSETVASSEAESKGDKSSDDQPE